MCFLGDNLGKAEDDFKQFINNTIAEETPENIAQCIIKYGEYC